MYELTLDTRFCAAHKMRGYEGQCERLHGHNYRVTIVLCGRELDDVGMLMDFREVKRLAAEVTGRLDHRYLNELPPFDTINPSAEHLARHVADGMAATLPEGIAVRSVTCWESDDCAARYVPDPPAGASGPGN